MKITDWILSKTTSASQSSSSSSSPLNSSTPSQKENQKQSKMPPKPKEKKSTGGGGGSSSQDKHEKEKPTTTHRHSVGSDTTTSVQGTHSTKTKQDVTLPQTKVKIIMKSSPEIDQVGADVLFLISKATELFIDHITTMTYTHSHKVRHIEYRHLAEMANKQPNMEFLRDIIPMKMLARDALKEVAKQKAQANRELLGD